MRAVEIIQRKRDGGELTDAMIDAFVRGSVDGTWPDYQLAALLMAVVWRGMTPAETARLTWAIAHSGRTLSWPELDAPKVDKHSSGGVGDKTTLVLVPLAAACGVAVPKMSGRGLGHSGGTLDKLESIPGFRTDLSADEFAGVLRRVGAVVSGQTADVAPADKKLYALRDVTATVESVPLLTSSILGKKLAEGLDALVLDVKFGSGAFLPALEDAETLAASLLDVAARNGLPTTVIISSMEAPLGRAVGNALEVREAIDTLSGGGPADLRELSLTLAQHMVARAFPDRDAAADVRRALDSGAGLAKFRQMVEAQGGDVRAIDQPSRLPAAPRVVPLLATASGYVSAIDARALGVGAMRLGAGRARAGDAIDPAVGLVLRAGVGDFLKAGEAWADAHTGPAGLPDDTRELLSAAVKMSEIPPTPVPRIAAVRTL